ncbi:MAG: thermonuclease family protein [Clostridia bacterium]|nr:thermonuclease family protein [Clostridia bacterium]
MKDTIKKIISFVVVIGIAVFVVLFMKDKINTAEPNTEVTDTIKALSNYLLSTDSNFTLTEAIVTKVVDGDTLWVTIDGKEEKVRLIGVNSPEYTKEIEPYGKEATEFTTTELLGKTVYLQKDVSDTDSYDRLLRYVWTKDVSDNLTDENLLDYLFNNTLIKEGLAESNYYKPDILFQIFLEETETQAKENKKGMWQ